MAKVKTTDPYGPGFFGEERPAPESVSDSISAQPGAAATAASDRLEGGGAGSTAVAHQEVTRPTVRLNADIDRDLHRRLRLRVASEGITIAEFLREILQRELG
jgi:hypothetical protein